MISIKNRKMLIPNEERYIGTTFDDNSQVLSFKVSRYTQNDIDLSALNAKADVYHCATQTEDRADLTMEVQDKYIILHLYITAGMVATPGTVLIDLKLFNDDGAVKWSSYKGAFFVEDPLTSPAGATVLSELEQLEIQIRQRIESAVDAAKVVTKEWLDENIGEIEGYVIDRTLSVGNAAADAEAVGNRFSTVGTQITGLQSKIDGLKTTRTNRKYVLIGDSYGMRNTPNWASLFVRVVGDDVLYNDQRSSYGFATGTLKFLAILTDAANALTAAQRESVTDIIVVGGWNDARWIKQNNPEYGVQLAIFEFCQYAQTQFPNAMITLEYCGWQLGIGAGIQDNVRIQHLLLAKRVYDGTYYKNLRHGQSMLKVMLNPYAYDSSGFHPNNAEGAHYLLYELLNDIAGTGTAYEVAYSMGSDAFTFPSGINGTVHISKCTQMDTMVKLDITIEDITGLTSGNTLCTIALAKLPLAVWSTISFNAFALVRNTPFKAYPLYCILNTDGTLDVYGEIPSVAWTLVIRDTLPMILPDA